MSPDHTTGIPGGARAADQSKEIDAIRKKMLGRDGRQKRNYQRYANRQLLVAHKSSEDGSGNVKVNGEDKKDFHGEQATALCTNVEVGGPETLAQLRKRHDELAAYIKKAEERITKHPRMIKRKAMRNAEEDRTRIKKEGTDSKENDEMDIDIKLD